MDRIVQAQALEELARGLRRAEPPVEAAFAEDGLVLRRVTTRPPARRHCDAGTGILAVLSHLCRSGAVDEWGRVHGPPAVLHEWERFLRGQLAELLGEMAVALREGRVESAYRHGAIVLTILRRVSGPVTVQDVVRAVPDLVALV